MKEFIKSQKVTYNLMSFTGFKSLLIFSILAEGPKSFEEIAEVIENNPYLREKMSTDTMRVYMNSLKKIGCEIKRVKDSDKVSRYVISSHPFELNLTKDQKKSVLTVYKTLVKSMDVKDLLYMDNLLEKIGKYVKDEDFIKEARNISMLSDINKKLLFELIDCCEKKLQIVISYNSPKSGKKDIEIVTDKIEIKNDKIYLCGFGLEYNEQGIFQINRIEDIKKIKISKTQLNNLHEITVRYRLESITGELELDENEKLIKRIGDKAIIEVTSSSEFMLRQKFLELGPACLILKPEKFKEDYIKTLNNMKARYYCE